jgi:DNA mismatch repair ATPase MutS
MNLMVVAAGFGKTNRIHRAVTGMHNYLLSIHQLLKTFEKEHFNSIILNDIKQNISGSPVSAAVSVKRLTRLIQAFDTRLNVLVGFILNGLLLWDYHCISRLEKWKSEYRQFFPLWIEMIGQTDALISFGNYAFNNPGFAYPEISGGKFLFSVSSAGHPLIGENKRVCNDFVLERSGTVCIISGANMSGKSTFLRTIAVNYILGMTGAPVCASEMIFTPMKLFTSMRTTDSLSANESYFYAELRRLKSLKSEIERGEPVLFILDEILKGTNSADKTLGSKLFMKRVIELSGTGLIATHDTTLGEMENDYPGVVINRCFEIEIEGETIKFDYKLRNGITRKMNAAILMKQMGILE